MIRHVPCCQRFKYAKIRGESYKAKSSLWSKHQDSTPCYCSTSTLIYSIFCGFKWITRTNLNLTKQPKKRTPPKRRTRTGPVSCMVWCGKSWFRLAAREDAESQTGFLAGSISYCRKWLTELGDSQVYSNEILVSDSYLHGFLSRLSRVV